MKEQYPELKDRIQASFIDMLLLVLLMFAIAAILDKFEHVPDWIRMVMFCALFIVYEPLCMTLGFTLGNYIKGIRVRKHTDATKRINIIQAMLRYPIKICLG